MRQRLILPTRPHLVRTEMDRLGANIGAAPNIVHEIDSMAAIRDFVASGLGCSVMPRGAVINAAYAGSVGSQLVVEPEIKRILHLAYSRKRSISKAFEAAVNVLRAIVDEERNRPGGQWQHLEAQVRRARAAES
jgi:LysR family nitrogen assimilation transcriptional regulator